MASPGTPKHIATLVVAAAFTSGGFNMTRASTAKETATQASDTPSGPRMTEERARAIIAPWYRCSTSRAEVTSEPPLCKY